MKRHKLPLQSGTVSTFTFTSVTKVTGFGKSTTQNIAGTRGYEISGLLVYPPWQAELKVDESDGDFGLWFYHSYGRANEARQPLLEIWVSDRDYSIRAAIASAHQAAVISGHKRLTGQVLEAQRDGIFTLEEAAAGCSSDRRYPLNGMYVWEQFESVHLPRWALPTPNERFFVRWNAGLVRSFHALETRWIRVRECLSFPEC